MPNDIDRLPWDQEPGEPTKHFDRFVRYKLIGPDRTLYSAYNQFKARGGSEGRVFAVPGAWRKIAKQWRWQERAEAWDAEQRRVEEAKWQARRAELREQEWGTATLLLDKVARMLSFPVEQTTRSVTSADGQTINTTIINPARWSFADAARLLDASSKVRRLAAEMETSHDVIEQTTSWEDELLAIYKDGKVTLERIEEEFGPNIAARISARSGILPSKA